ncbi:MAG: hypothetical protein IKK57_05405 [Clostridia bacterium]|nr:hypothetical protein [Clostridia bacterium]MBR6668520.1 hypothetical protein [Clostridia bacterium]
MKKLLAMVLVVAMCIAMTTVGAQASGINKLVGYWEVQNVAVGGYTVGANYLGFEMHAVIHEDGICILVLDDEMMAGHIRSYGGNYYLEDSDESIPMSYDSQGRIHIDLTNGGSTKLDVRMRKATPERLPYSLNSYVGNYTLKGATLDGVKVNVAELGNIRMTIYEDGYAALTSDNAVIPLRLIMVGSSVYFVDADGWYVTLEKSGNTLKFTLSSGGTRLGFVMERSLY